MKKNILLQIFVLLLFYNCSTDKFEKKLIGDWYPEEQSSLQELKFSKDSLIIINTIGSTHQTWNADKSTIYLHNLTFFRSNIAFKKSFSYKYLLSNNDDTLTLILKNDSVNKGYKFIRKKNQLEYFQKLTGLKLDLPKSDDNIISIGDVNFDPHYYIGYLNGKLMIQYNSQFIDLTDAFGEIYQLKMQLNENDFKKLKIDLFADKNIPEFKMDSIKNILRKTEIKRIFRVYKNDTIDYKKNLKWYGKFE
jgi:hypothetical protein